MTAAGDFLARAFHASARYLRRFEPKVVITMDYAGISYLSWSSEVPFDG